VERIRTIAGIDGPRALLDGFPEPAALLDGERRIVAANRAMRELAGMDGERLLGRRPGDVLACVHADEADGGCGDGEGCRDCGALFATLGALRGDGRTVEECRVRRAGGEALDLRVHATPLEVDGQPFVLVALQDTTHEKRRQVLERIFFHDALNLAGGMQGMAELRLEQVGAGERELVEQLHGLSTWLVEELRAQSDLAAAERGDLVVQRTAFDAVALCEQVAHTWRGHEVGRGRTIAVGHRGDLRVVRGDVTLLRRVLGNLVKNALEASRPGETVTLEFSGEGAAAFTVRNPGVMRDDVLRQAFQRSFTTRGERGRGVGLYGVRLLTERYLGGRVDCSSRAGEGTRFTVTLPA